MEILREHQTPGGLVRLLADQVLSDRGRVIAAMLTITVDDEIAWTGPDTPANAPQWQAALARALAGTDEPATTKKRGKK